VSMLSLEQPIETIGAVKALHAGHPVFLLAADDGSHLVVKQESTTDAANMRRNFLTMNMASPQARSVILTPPEVEALKRYVKFCRFVAKHDPTSPVPADVSELAKYLNAGGTWFKMKEAKGLIDLKAAARQMLEGDKTGVRAMAKALNESGGLEALGKIVAADMFNNNTDRFAPNNAGKVFVKTDTDEVKFDVKCLVNVGNVMAAMSGGKLKAIGLDSWDPTADGNYADMTKNVGYGWLGDILAPDKKADRLKFAQDIADDLNLLLGPRNRKFSFLQQTRLNPDAPKRIAGGMDKMIKKLIDKMEASLKRPNPPAGLQSRLVKLRGH